MTRRYTRQRFRTSDAGREKFCGYCGQWWPLASFFKGSGAGGLDNRCKGCLSEMPRRQRKPGSRKAFFLGLKTERALPTERSHVNMRRGRP